MKKNLSDILKDKFLDITETSLICVENKHIEYAHSCCDGLGPMPPPEPKPPIGCYHTCTGLYE